MQAIDLIGSSGRTRTYNPSVNSAVVRLGVRMLSTEYRGDERTIWSLFGAQFGEEFGEAISIRAIF